jgi:hypothetical protein
MIREELCPGIVSYKNVTGDSLEFIQYIENLVYKNKLMWHQASQSDGAEGDGSVVKKSARDCFAMSLPSYDKNPEFKNEENVYTQVSTKIDERLLPTVNDYRSLYAAHHWNISEGWQLLKYGKDNHFVKHYDDSKQYPRTVSMSYYLNDDYEGGEIEFPNFNLKIKPSADQVIMFPSNYVYTHTVHPVVSGTRYAIVGWWD